MRPFAFFDRRVRGFRVVELGALGVLLVLILTVYLAKTGAGGKRADIDRIQQQIFDEQTQIRMLRAEVATLEQPERLEALSARYLGLQPISARREVTPQALVDVAQVATADHKTTLVAADPLTQPGSPDVGAAPAAAPVEADPAAAPPVPAAPAPIVKLAQADAAPRHVAAARPAVRATPRPAAGASIDALLQSGAAPASAH
jgi:cell division protein FtsL